MELYWRAGEGFSNSALEVRGGPGEMEEGENLARTIPTSNPDPDQEQGSSGVWCVASGGKERKRSRALAPVRPASDAARAAIGSRIRKKEKRHTHPVEPRRFLPFVLFLF
jgi:hypothetical protein